MKNRKILINIFFIVLFSLIFSKQVLALSIPTVITHNAANIAQNSATLNGEVTNGNGCLQLEVWFQYGATTSYSNTTPHQSRSSIGSFSADIFGLNVCTLYHFRAAAENNQGVAYSADDTFMTACPLPTVDIKANNSNGPITIPYNTSANLSWTSSNAESCSASLDWSGSKQTSGSELISNLTSSKTYNIACAGPGGTASDAVTVNVSPNHPPVANAGPDKEVFETQSIILEGSGSDPDSDPITFDWSCSGGSLSNPNISQPTFATPSVASDMDYSCALTVIDSHGASASDSMNVKVKNQTVSVTLEAIPSAGQSPLNDVDLKATVSGTAQGAIAYKFDCANDGGWDHIFNNISDNPKTVADACDYLTGGVYNAKVSVERGTAEPVSALATISVTSPVSLPLPAVDIKANNSNGPITIPYNTSANLSWTSSNADSCSASVDWSGSKQTSGSELINNLTSSKTYNIACAGPGGTASDAVTVNVVSPTLSVSLSSSPSSVCAYSNNNIGLTAIVSGTPGNNTNYFFDCTNDGNWERIFTNNSNTYTANNLCLFSSPGNYNAKVRVEREGLSAENTARVNVFSCSASLSSVYTPTVDIRANGSNGPITIPYNTSANLSWTASNANSCSAYGSWSGAKMLSGIEATGNLTFSRTYGITCIGAGGTVSDNVTVDVSSSPASFTIDKSVRNLSDGTGILNEVNADPLEVLSFSIKITAGSSPVQNITLKDILPDRIFYRNNSLKIDGVFYAGDILAGFNIGNLAAYQVKTITFDADIVNKDRFNYGQTQLINSAIAYNADVSVSDTAKVVVSKTAIAGATTVPTGFTNNPLTDSFLIPLLMILSLISIFRTQMIKMKEWYASR